ncbi:MAG TPA: VOC family protein [Acidimicrobiales bacterium]|nr:VOC family protein [Acidimicrobiales bacterium]
MGHPVTGPEFLASDGVGDWRVIWGAGWASAHYRTVDYETAVRLAHRVGVLAAAASHPADVDLRPGGVTVRLLSGEPGGLSSDDVELARSISAAAAELGAAADPSAVQHVQVAIDAASSAAVAPFWQAVLGYESLGDEDVLDPLRRGPSFWFQRMDVPRTERGRVHVDVYLPHDEAERRIAAALAAGGHVVDDSHAPEWWTLADAEGNEADVAIWMQ